jgi:hypothetical protein
MCERDRVVSDLEELYQVLCVYQDTLDIDPKLIYNIETVIALLEED